MKNNKKTIQKIYLSFAWEITFLSCFFYYLRKKIHFNCFDEDHWNKAIDFLKNYQHTPSTFDNSIMTTLMIAPILLIVGNLIVLMIPWKKWFSAPPKKSPDTPVFEPVYSGSVRPQKLSVAGTQTDFSFLDKANKTISAEHTDVTPDQEREASVNQETVNRETANRGSINQPHENSIDRSHEDSAVRQTSDGTLHTSSKTSDPEAPLNQQFKVSDTSYRANRAHQKDSDIAETFELIKNLAKDLGYDYFEKIMTQKDVIPLVLSYHETSVSLDVFQSNSKIWVASEEENLNGDLPLWFSEEGDIPSPFGQLAQKADLLARELETKSIPVLVISKEKIVNADEVLPIWVKKGYVARFQDGKPENLPTLENVLKDIQIQIDQQKNE